MESAPHKYDLLKDSPSNSFPVKYHVCETKCSVFVRVCVCARARAHVCVCGTVPYGSCAIGGIPFLLSSKYHRFFKNSDI